MNSFNNVTAYEFKILYDNVIDNVRKYGAFIVDELEYRPDNKLQNYFHGNWSNSSKDYFNNSKGRFILNDHFIKNSF